MNVKFQVRKFQISNDGNGFLNKFIGLYMLLSKEKQNNNKFSFRVEKRKGQCTINIHQLKDNKVITTSLHKCITGSQHKTGVVQYTA